MFISFDDRDTRLVAGMDPVRQNGYLAGQGIIEGQPLTLQGTGQHGDDGLLASTSGHNDSGLGPCPLEYKFRNGLDQNTQSFRPYQFGVVFVDVCA